MIIQTYNENHQYLLFIDIEFTNKKLVQFAGLIFQQIDNNENSSTYQLMRSTNVYITQKVCYPFMEYTHITNNFLIENGITLADAQELIINNFLKNIPLDQTLIVSHGLKNDRLVLKESGIDLINVSTDTLIDGYCTYKNAVKILGRQNNLTLTDIASEFGYYLSGSHNAYNDVWAEVSIFTTLKKIEFQRR